MKKILFLLFALITLQYNAAQSLYERKNVGNDIYVFTQDTTIKPQTCKNNLIKEENTYTPPITLKGEQFLAEVCNKYKPQNVKGWMNVFLYSDLKGNITNITLAFPKDLKVTDNEVSAILLTAQEKCKLEFPIEGIYKYSNWAIFNYVVDLEK